MAPQKETIMVLKVELDCYRCYIKVKKLLSQFPQIQDQIYNMEKQLVTIKVVCCSPEKIRDKLCYKGGKSIKCIEIVEPNKPALKPPPPSKPTEQAPPPDKIKKRPKRVTFKVDEQQPKGAEADAKPAQQPAPMAHVMPAAVYGYYGYVNVVDCLDCYDGPMCYHHGHGYGFGVPPAGGWGYYGGGAWSGYGHSFNPGYWV